MRTNIFLMREIMILEEVLSEDIVERENNIIDKPDL
jgi:hypothetical protein